MASKLAEGNRLDPLTLNIEIKHEADFLKRLATKHLSRTTGIFYNHDWVILCNDTGTPFITSDNPSAFVPINPPARVLPISPSLCLYLNIDARFGSVEHFDFGPQPEGSCAFREISRQEVMDLNRISTLNANDFVFSRYEDVGIEAFVKKYRNYKAQVNTVTFPADEGALKGATLVIEPRRDK